MDALAKSRGRPPLGPHEIETLRGGDMGAVLARLGLRPRDLPAAARQVRRLAEDAPAPPLFPGARAMLRTLAAQEFAVAVVSSNSDTVVRRALGDEAALVRRYGCGVSLFGKAARLRRLVRGLRVEPQAALAVGDELRDAEAAREAGLAFAAVSWGFATPAALARTEPVRTFARVDEIAPFLLEPA